MALTCFFRFKIKKKLKIVTKKLVCIKQASFFVVD